MILCYAFHIFGFLGEKMKDKLKKLLYSDRFVIIIGLIVVPILSFILITISEESPLYTSISRIAWVNGGWLATFVWALVIMFAISWLTYLLVFSGPLSDRTKKAFFVCELVHILLAFIGCIVFPAKVSTDFVNFFNYIHDYLTIAAWALYGIGLLAYSILLKKHDRFLGFLGSCLMSFVIISSLFFIARVVDPTSYVGASAVSEVYIINSFFIYLVVMYMAQKLKLGNAAESKGAPEK